MTSAGRNIHYVYIRKQLTQTNCKRFILFTACFNWMFNVWCQPFFYVCLLVSTSTSSLATCDLRNWLDIKPSKLLTSFFLSLLLVGQIRGHFFVAKWVVRRRSSTDPLQTSLHRCLWAWWEDRTVESVQGFLLLLLSHREPRIDVEANSSEVAFQSTVLMDCSQAENCHLLIAHQLADGS